MGFKPTPNFNPAKKRTSTKQDVVRCIERCDGQAERYPSTAVKDWFNKYADHLRVKYYIGPTIKGNNTVPSLRTTPDPRSNNNVGQNTANKPTTPRSHNSREDRSALTPPPTRKSIPIEVGIDNRSPGPRRKPTGIGFSNGTAFSQTNDNTKIERPGPPNTECQIEHTAQLQVHGGRCDKNDSAPGVTHTETPQGSSAQHRSIKTTELLRRSNLKTANPGSDDETNYHSSYPEVFLTPFDEA